MLRYYNNNFSWRDIRGDILLNKNFDWKLGLNKTERRHFVRQTFKLKNNATAYNQIPKPLFGVITHEIGHSLGLCHNVFDPNALMAADSNLWKVKPNHKIGDYDLLRLNKLYGKNRKHNLGKLKNFC